MKTPIAFAVIILVLFAFLLLGCAHQKEIRPPSKIMDPANWEIGPIIDGKNKSVGLPVRPAISDEGWAFDFPQPEQDHGHVHYVTFRHGSLTGKSRLVIRYMIEAEANTRFPAVNYPNIPGRITAYLQRRGDNWSADGKYETYRWYYTTDSRELSAGEHELIAPLNGRWTALRRTRAALVCAMEREMALKSDTKEFVAASVELAETFAQPAEMTDAELDAVIAAHDARITPVFMAICADMTTLRLPAPAPKVRKPRALKSVRRVILKANKEVRAQLTAAAQKLGGSRLAPIGFADYSAFLTGFDLNMERGGDTLIQFKAIKGKEAQPGSVALQVRIAGDSLAFEVIASSRIEPA